MTAALQASCVEQFHQKGHGTADWPLASFPIPNCSAIANPQQVGKAGLCKPGPLSNGFEL